MLVECFARRILGPFQGVLQIVQVGDGEAESTDGVNWVLYAAHPDILAHSGLSEVRFGTWSRSEGLRRAMVRGTAAGDLIEGIGQPLIGALEAYAGQIPFPLRDHMEYWLLDADTGRPLVLIDSRLAEESLPPAELARWLPGQAARSEFEGIADLDNAIARRAGRRPTAQWFRRNDDGCAVDGDGALYEAGFFPRLLLTTDWPTSEVHRVAEAFIEWWSPFLLQLQHLDDDERRQLERVAAVRRPASLARTFRLYPSMLDERLIRVARVQARLQRSRSTAAHYVEPFVWAD